MNYKKVIYFALAITCFLGMKADDSPLITITHTTSGKYKYIIEIKGSEIVNGGPCNYPQKPKEIKKSDWIYTNEKEGVINAENLVFTFHSKEYAEDPTVYPWKQSNLKGQIELKANEININLKFPYYKDGHNIDKYVDYKYNGLHKIITK
jgi:hypothetical protein